MISPIICKCVWTQKVSAWVSGRRNGYKSYSSSNLDVTCPDERRLALEVLRVDNVVFAGVEDELGQVNLALVDGVE